MKKRIIKIAIFLVVAGIVFGFIYRDYKRYKNSDAYKFKEEYEKLNGELTDSGKTIREVEISKKNKMIYSTADEIAKKIDNNETFVVYFGFASCPWCRTMITSLINISMERDVNVYYVDIKEIRDTLELVNGEVVMTKKGTKGYEKLLDKLGIVLSDYSLKDENGNEVETNEKRIYAPNVVAVVNGTPIKKVEGVSSKVTDPYHELTDEMKSEGVDQLECIFKCLEENNVCTKKEAC